MEVADWGICLCLEQEIPKDITSVGYRAHDFVPVWGEKKKNCLKVKVKSMAEMPFEYNYYLLPEEKSSKMAVSWFVQKEKHQQLLEKGLPDYLEIQEDCLMMLR